MLVSEESFTELMGYTPPNFNKWQMLAVNDIKYIFKSCYTEDLTTEQLEILKNGISLQMDHRFINDDIINGVTSFSVGKFSTSRGGTGAVQPFSKYSKDMYSMLKDLFNCSLAIDRGARICGLFQ